MDSIPAEALPLVQEFLPVFTRPTYQRFVVLTFAAILTTGRRTIANLLRTAGPLAPGDTASYQRVLSHAHWSGWRLAAALTGFVLRHLWATGRIRLVGDDTVTEHRGKQVYGKARHRDPVRSSHRYTAYRYGHKWVTLAVLVSFPFASRPWALPVLVALYRSPQENRRRGRRHRTPAQIMQLLVRVLLRWFPERQFVLSGDAGYGSHQTARLTSRYRGRLTVVSRFHPDANLYEPPPPASGQKGRRRKKGAKLPAPEKVVAKSKRQTLEVSWYGGGRRRVAVVTGAGHWYKSGQGLVAVRWVYVHDLQGTHRDEYFYSTDPTATAAAVIEEYTGRWNIETTYQEARAYLGLETTRGWCAKTVLRAEPCLLGLYTVVALLYWRLPEVVHGDWQVIWIGKEKSTFSDAISSVRRWLWQEWILKTLGQETAFQKLPEGLQEIILYAVAPAT